VDAAGRPVRIARHIEPEDTRADVRARREVELFAVLVENRMACVTQAIGDLLSPGFFERIDEDGAVPGLERLRVHDPPAVGRPVEVARETAANAVDLYGHPLIDIHVPEVEALVSVCDLLAVGRPVW